LGRARDAIHEEVVEGSGEGDFSDDTREVETIKEGYVNAGREAMTEISSLYTLHARGKERS
jgi:hypothetical protein